jgi:hypothetical protein
MSVKGNSILTSCQGTCQDDGELWKWVLRQDRESRFSFEDISLSMASRKDSRPLFIRDPFSFDPLVHLSLSKDYEMVSEPGPNTLHVQAAITRADPAYVVLRAVSTIPAPMNYLAPASLLKELGTGKPLFVVEASIEMKISDALTGEVLGASADRRVGKKRLDAVPITAVPGAVPRAASSEGPHHGLLLGSCPYHVPDRLYQCLEAQHGTP